ncbi:unnamed protein product [Absidia cylindrospora]
MAECKSNLYSWNALANMLTAVVNCMRCARTRLNGSSHRCQGLGTIPHTHLSTVARCCLRKMVYKNTRLPEITLLVWPL